MHPLDIELMDAASRGDEAEARLALSRAAAERARLAKGPLGWLRKLLLPGLLPSGPLARRSDPVDGGTALTMAARGGHCGCVALLLPISDPEALNGAGRTALMLAAIHGRAGALRLLTKRCDPNARCSGKTALLLAAENGHAECASILAGIPGIDPSARDGRRGQDALMAACRGGWLGLACLLASKFPELASGRDSQGRTALMLLAESRERDPSGRRPDNSPAEEARAAGLLLAAGGAGARDRQGARARDYAEKAGKPHLAKLIADAEIEERRAKPMLAIGGAPGTPAARR